MFGDSAGSSSIGNLVASPLTKGLFQRALGESGAWMGLSVAPMTKLDAAEQAGVRTAKQLGANSLAELRAKPAAELLTGRGGGPVIDGWFLPDDPANIYAQGKQNDVPLLLGSNKDEATFFQGPTTADAFTKTVNTRFGDLADGVLQTLSRKFRRAGDYLLFCHFSRPARLRDAQLGGVTNQERQVQSVSLFLYA